MSNNTSQSNGKKKKALLIGGIIAVIAVISLVLAGVFGSDDSSDSDAKNTADSFLGTEHSLEDGKLPTQGYDPEDDYKDKTKEGDSGIALKELKNPNMPPKKAGNHGGVFESYEFDNAGNYIPDFDRIDFGDVYYPPLVSADGQNLTKYKRGMFNTNVNVINPGGENKDASNFAEGQTVALLSYRIRDFANTNCHIAGYGMAAPRLVSSQMTKTFADYCYDNHTPSSLFRALIGKNAYQVVTEGSLAAQGNGYTYTDTETKAERDYYVTLGYVSSSSAKVTDNAPQVQVHIVVERDSADNPQWKVTSFEATPIN